MTDRRELQPGNRPVVCRLIATFIKAFPEDWNEDSINFHFQESSHCLQSEIIMMEQAGDKIFDRNDAQIYDDDPLRIDLCACVYSEAEYVREAEPEDYAKPHRILILPGARRR